MACAANPDSQSAMLCSLAGARSDVALLMRRNPGSSVPHHGHSNPISTADNGVPLPASLHSLRFLPARRPFSQLLYCRSSTLVPFPESKHASGHAPDASRWNEHASGHLQHLLAVPSLDAPVCQVMSQVQQQWAAECPPACASSEGSLAIRHESSASTHHDPLGQDCSTISG